METNNLHVHECVVGCLGLKPVLHNISAIYQWAGAPGVATSIKPVLTNK